MTRIFPDKCSQCLESLLSFRSTRLDIERFHGDPPEMANHRNTTQMFPGFSHTRRVPSPQKLSSRATLTLNSFRVRSAGIASHVRPSLESMGVSDFLTKV